MLHNLEWLHDLKVQYDASTFDFDPFEPQPDGTGTIFPFLVNNGSDLRHRNVDSPAASVPGPRSNYVELPYTLPQDSTLFLLLQERNASIWLKKLAWIAQRGGMALVNVHPDYLRFPDEPEDDRTYPVGHYVDLLQAIQKQRERVWCPLPHQLAAWCHETGCRPAAEITSPAPSTAVSKKDGKDSLLGRRIAVLLYSSYPSDSRPRRAAEAMVQAGARVELICPKETSKALAREEIGGVEVTRVPLSLRRGGKLTYFYQYGMFFLACGLVLTRRTFRRKYDAIHAHNMPDFLVWAAWLPRLLGAKIILDLHDPMPELFMSLYHRDRHDRMIRCLSWLERRCVAFAHLVLTPNEAFRQRFVSRSGCVGKIQVIMNSPEEQIFSPGPAESTAAARSGGFRVMHHGLIAERHGLDIAIEAISLLRSSIPDLTFEIFGERKVYLDRILELARERGVEDRVHFHGMVSEQEIARQIHQSDLGVIPNRWSPFIEINLPTRIFEYLALHRPVIVPFTSGIRDYFGADDILYFQPNSATDLARQILWVRQNPAISQEIANRGYSVYQQHLWRNERLKFLTLVARLFQPVTAEENVLNALTLP